MEQPPKQSRKSYKVKRPRLIAAAKRLAQEVNPETGKRLTLDEIAATLASWRYCHGKGYRNSKGSPFHRQQVKRLIDA